MRAMFTVPAELTAAARRMPHLRLLVLHGSRARGAAHERSDWDFAYLADAGFDPDALIAALVDAAGHDRVDAVDLDRAGALIRHRVARDGVVVQESEPGAFDEFRLQAIHDWCDLEPVLTPLYESALREMAGPGP
jgi:predicted nucleotidyltransferase